MDQLADRARRTVSSACRTTSVPVPSGLSGIQPPASWLPVPAAMPHRCRLIALYAVNICEYAYRVHGAFLQYLLPVHSVPLSRHWYRGLLHLPLRDILCHWHSPAQWWCLLRFSAVTVGSFLFAEHTCFRHNHQGLPAAIPNRSISISFSYSYSLFERLVLNITISDRRLYRIPALSFLKT